MKKKDKLYIRKQVKGCGKGGKRCIWKRWWCN